jgi:hypothetical protein
LSKGYKSSGQFIATQWPLDDTVVDFWRLIKDYDVQNIVILEDMFQKVPLYAKMTLTRSTITKSRMVSLNSFPTLAKAKTLELSKYAVVRTEHTSVRC